MGTNIQSTGKRKHNTGNPTWQKGVCGNPKGRPKGKPNIYTKEIRDSILYVFRQMKGKKGVLEWAKENKTQFYKEMFNLLPKEIAVEGDMNVSFTWEADGKQSNGPL